MYNVFLNVMIAAIVIGGIAFGVNYWLARKNGETISIRYIITIATLFAIYTGLFCFIQLNFNKKVHAFNGKIQQMTDEQNQLKAEQERMKATYAKELAFMEWKNKVFTSNAEMNKSLDQAKTDYKLNDTEIRTWRNVAENNTLEKLMPKTNPRDVLTEYQKRLKGSLADIKSGQTLAMGDIRMLSDNINAIRFVGKEYEKVLGSFRELYNNINTANANGTELSMPKQQKFLFFPVKQKEYNQLLQQYYESKGNSKAMGDVAVQLKDAIDKAEAEFKRINKKFEDNLGFLQNNSDSISYNSEKLEKLIEAAISEAEIINESNSKTDIKINKTNKN